MMGHHTNEWNNAKRWLSAKKSPNIFSCVAIKKIGAWGITRLVPIGRFGFWTLKFIDDVTIKKIRHAASSCYQTVLHIAVLCFYENWLAIAPSLLTLPIWGYYCL